MKKIILSLIFFFAWVNSIYAISVGYTNATDNYYLYKRDSIGSFTGSAINSQSSSDADISRDGNLIGYRHANRLFLKTAYGTDNGTDRFGFDVGQFCFTYDGNILFIKSGTDNVYLASIYGTDLGTQQTNQYSNFPGCSYTSNTFAYTGPSNIGYISTYGGGINNGSAITSVSAINISFSTDDLKMAFSSNTSGTSLIYLRPFGTGINDGSGVTTQTSYFPIFSPFSNDLIYGAGDSTIWDKDSTSISNGISITPASGYRGFYFPSTGGFSNQPKPSDYFANIDGSTLTESTNNSNCLYTNPDTTIFSKYVQFCKPSDYPETSGSNYDRFCSDGSFAYIHLITNGGHIFIKNMVCSTKNDEAGITDVKTNTVTIEPYHTFPSIVTETGANIGGYVKVLLLTIQQTYPQGYNSFLLGTDLVRNLWPSFLDHMSPIGTNTTISGNTSLHMVYKYYADNNYYDCVINRPITCPLTPYTGGVLTGYPVEFWSNPMILGTKTYNVGTGAINLNTALASGTPKLTGSAQDPYGVSPEQDTSVFMCTFVSSSWYEYIGSPFICFFQIMGNIYGKGASFVTSISYFLQNMFLIGSDRSATQSIGMINSIFGIYKANAVGTGTGIAQGIVDGFVATSNGEGGYLGPYYKFLWYAIYTMVFFLIVTFILVYKASK